jgi:glucan biosynthesis protein C
MLNRVVSDQTGSVVQGASRLHYLDTLRVLAMLGVFVFHALCVFNDVPFHIKNAEQSSTITALNALLAPWGMPLFFTIAGAGSWFALRRRTAGQYVHERLNRLVIPLVVGSILLSPVQLYCEWRHKVQTGVTYGTFAAFVQHLPWGPNPRIFGVVGYHLWFLGFLFCFSLLTLPLFRWLRGNSGQRVVSAMARLSERRGATLLVILPLLLVRLGLHPFFPQQHNWADFCFLFCFFVLGYLMLADERFTLAIRRDWPIALAVGSVAFLAAAAMTVASGELDIEAAPRTLLDVVWWGLFTACGWCWTAFMLFVGMRFLNRSNRWLQYSQEAILPFFVLHQPAIIGIAYFVVQWRTAMLIKIGAVILGALLVSIGIYQLIIRRAGLLRAMFGMKTSHVTTYPQTRPV